MTIELYEVGLYQQLNFGSRSKSIDNQWLSASESFRYPYC